MTFAELLTPAEVERLHEASLDVLESVGILAHHPGAREVLGRHGCVVDGDTGLVKFPSDVVERYRKMVPPRFTFRGRDPRFDRTVPDDGPTVVTGSSAPNVIDPVTGVERRATSTDIARIAYLVNELPGFDVFSISTLAADAPEGQFSLSRFYPALKNCLKPVRSNTPTMADLHGVLELGELIVGGRDAYRERPIINHHYCPMVSPLTMDVDSTEAVMWLTEQGLPVYTTVVPNAGLTAPMTLPGCLVVGNAEFLAITVLQQMVREATPVIYAGLPTVADMRTGAYTPGAIETGLLIAAQAQLARFYGVPAGGYIGLTNAHANDAQAGFETGMNTMLAVEAGATLLNMGGLLGSLMAFDFGKCVTDNEIALMDKRAWRGLEFGEDELALDEIAAVGPGGSYMGRDHTKKRMRTAAFLPRLAERGTRSQWEDAGRPQLQDRALAEARRILAAPNPAVWDGALDARIREHFPGIVDGDATSPEALA
ncbi:MAG TPA: trimethylamine methyltransferase family protein [Thermoleophilia bacterium]|nr:trimethylamine methyltransferase family protein [Thermoleophilia bacterium]HQJ98476.1 trimethylamine methyltransferase family protein [Thermoleophilia bacterium]